ncbi:hypothetical protein PRZ48_005923 [Zasmidium cellare]|uniref:Uncharacterized protein n=1 Tax=Zasmidium cellare TaxID=395010 RepID=A0ABR0EMZ8_ZASCE|nr:hypothetical protein PRZ48_005923 [Zasmidium cellare]
MAKNSSKVVKPVSKPVVSRRDYRTIDNDQEAEGSRRNKLIEERDEEVWLNKRVTSKGTVVGWYLAPESHEPFWINRKVRARGSTYKATFTPKALKIYQERLLFRIKNMPSLTTGEMEACHRLFQKPGPTPEQIEKARKEREQASAELAKILDKLNQGVVQKQEVAVERSAAQKYDDAAMKAYKGVKSNACEKGQATVENINVMAEEDGDGSGWLFVGQDQVYE